MASVNPIILPQLKNILIKLSSMGRERALEVGCGEGHVTKEVLSKLFYEIDLFDPSPVAIELVKALKVDYPKINRVELSKMENFAWDATWNCIVFRYVFGYPEND